MGGGEGAGRPGARRVARLRGGGGGDSALPSRGRRDSRAQGCAARGEARPQAAGRGGTGLPQEEEKGKNSLSCGAARRRLHSERGIRAVGWAETWGRAFGGAEEPKELRGVETVAKGAAAASGASGRGGGAAPPRRRPRLAGGGAGLSRAGGWTRRGGRARALLGVERLWANFEGFPRDACCSSPQKEPHPAVAAGAVGVPPGPKQTRSGSLAAAGTPAAAPSAPRRPRPGPGAGKTLMRRARRRRPGSELPPAASWSSSGGERRCGAPARPRRARGRACAPWC